MTLGNHNEKYDEEVGHDLNRTTSVSKGSQRRVSIIIENDAVFGDITDDGPNYRSVSRSQYIGGDVADFVQVGWKGTSVLMLKTQIGLGVLSLPQVFDTLGLIPGVIVLLIIASMTTWSNYIVGVFKLRHADVYGIDDVGRKLFGRVGYEIFGIAFALCEPLCNSETKPSADSE